MKFNCCGREREGLFCNQCGTSADAASPIGSLLKHLVDSEKMNLKRAKTSTESAKHSSNSEYYLKSAKQSTATAAKYRAWVGAIEALMSEKKHA